MSRRLWFAWLLVPCMVMACSSTDHSAEGDTPTPDAADTVAPEDPEDQTTSDPGSETYWPSTEAWETVTPEEAGADVNKLNEAIEFARQNGIHKCFETSAMTGKNVLEMFSFRKILLF